MEFVAYAVLILMILYTNQIATSSSESYFGSQNGSNNDNLDPDQIATSISESYFGSQNASNNYNLEKLKPESNFQNEVLLKSGICNYNKHVRFGRLLASTTFKTKKQVLEYF